MSTEVSIEEELWNIYSYAALHGNPKDPSRLSSNALLKMCRETWLLDATMTEKPITPAEVQLFFKSEQQSPEKGGAASGRGVTTASSTSAKSDKLNYTEFLSCLIRIAHRCYPSCKSPEEAMQQLLMDNILPLASRRKPGDMSAIVKQPPVIDLFKYYEDALLQLFRFYATASAKSGGSKSSLNTTSERDKSFDEAAERIKAQQKKQQQTPGSKSGVGGSSSGMGGGSSSKRAGENSLANAIGYQDFVKFSADFGMQSSMGLTTLDLGDIYLSVIQMGNFEASVRKMTFREFWEALVRCALLAFRTNTRLTNEEKLKCMFLYMWRHIQHSVQDQVNGTSSTGGGGNTYKGGLIRGAQILNEKFIAAWEKDGYKDYLLPQPTVAALGSAAKASSMLNKLITRSKDALTGSQLNSSMLDDSHRSRVVVDIEDDADLGDDRIKPSALRVLLQNRPDIASLLHACVLEEGLETTEKVFQDCKLTSGRNTFVVPPDNPLGGITIGLRVSGTGIPPGATVAAVDFERSTITLSSVVALSGAYTLTFSAT